MGRQRLMILLWRFYFKWYINNDSHEPCYNSLFLSYIEYIQNAEMSSSYTTVYWTIFITISSLDLPKNDGKAATIGVIRFMFPKHPVITTMA